MILIADMNFHGLLSDFFLLAAPLSIIIFIIALMLGLMEVFLLFGILFVAQIDITSKKSLKKRK